MTDSICEDSSKLSVRGLVKRFDGKETLHNLTFDVREGEFLSILGPSGCGKTTTLRILIGLLEPDEGMILLDGRDITRAAPDDRGMGIVFQNYALFENMTVLGNVEYALKFKPELRGDRRAIATSVLEQIGLIDLMDRWGSGSFGWSAAAGVHCPHAGAQSEDHPIRRADERARRRSSSVVEGRAQAYSGRIRHHDDLHHP